MPNKCEACGNTYEDIFEVRLSGETKSHWFDCFECAVHSLAPECEHCGVKILGHGVQIDRQVFCCAHCARAAGQYQAVDHEVIYP